MDSTPAGVAVVTRVEVLRGAALAAFLAVHDHGPDVGGIWHDGGPVDVPDGPWFRVVEVPCAEEECGFSLSLRVRGSW